ncbi:hypothetical protein DV738_g4750, partial [Chaetothyriales sp. CBS 135597]
MEDTQADDQSLSASTVPKKRDAFAQLMSPRDSTRSRQPKPARISAMNAPDPPAELPPGRDFASELKVGIHAHPSMNQLHIHIISPDMSRDTMRHRKHYNSFNTDFFIPLADFPLHRDDPRKTIAYQNDNLKKDFQCWRCGRMFGNKFKELKDHLKRELDEWKRE